MRARRATAPRQALRRTPPFPQPTLPGSFRALSTTLGNRPLSRSEGHPDGHVGADAEHAARGSAELLRIVREVDAHGPEAQVPADHPPEVVVVARAVRHIPVLVVARARREVRL